MGFNTDKRLVIFYYKFKQTIIDILPALLVHTAKIFVNNLVVKTITTQKSQIVNEIFFIKTILFTFKALV